VVIAEAATDVAIISTNVLELRKSGRRVTFDALMHSTPQMKDAQSPEQAGNKAGAKQARRRGRTVSSKLKPTEDAVPIDLPLIAASATSHPGGAQNAAKGPPPPAPVRRKSRGSSYSGAATKAPAATPVISHPPVAADAPSVPPVSREDFAERLLSDAPDQKEIPLNARNKNKRPNRRRTNTYTPGSSRPPSGFAPERQVHQQQLQHQQNQQQEPQGQRSAPLEVPRGGKGEGNIKDLVVAAPRPQGRRQRRNTVARGNTADFPAKRQDQGKPAGRRQSRGASTSAQGQGPLQSSAQAQQEQQPRIFTRKLKKLFRK
jgi:hypothetical protein